MTSLTTAVDDSREFKSVRYCVRHRIVEEHEMIEIVKEFEARRNQDKHVTLDDVAMDVLGLTGNVPHGTTIAFLFPSEK